MSNITAAPAPITCDGVEYLVSVLSDRDQDSINNWLRSTMLDIARGALRPGMPQEERDELLGAAMREARKLDFTSPESKPVMRSLNGVGRVFYQSLLAKHPDMTYDKARGLLKEPGVADQFVALLQGVLGMVSNSGPNSQGSSSTTA